MTVAPADNLVTVTIDGVEVAVPKGTLVIRAAEQAGVAIPRFCDHPLLEPVGACRQCLVEIPDAGNGRGFPKPQPSCTMTVADGMRVETQQTSEPAARAQRDVLELMLINHPLDCPICDKGGECPLQNQALEHGRGQSRYDGVKRTYAKPIPLSPQLLLDRERCVLCARCTRFAEQISGDPLIGLLERGAKQQIGAFDGVPYNSYFSGNVVQICPVGAITSQAYRFAARPFDLVSTVTTCEHCAAGCQLRVDHRHYEVKRRQAGDDPAANQEWSCDVGRFAFASARGDDRLTRPLRRGPDGLEPAAWPDAIDAVAAALSRAQGRVGLQTGGRLTLETALSYARFAHAVLGTADVDFRARPQSPEEAQFLAAAVAGRGPGQAVSYADLDRARRVVLVGFEPEDESPIVFLRLRRAVLRHGLKVQVVAPLLSPGSRKLSAQLIPAPPGAEAAALAGLEGLDADCVILVGERLAGSPGALSALLAVARSSAAAWAWIPRRAGELAALEAGLLPGLLPGGRPWDDPGARAQLAAAWGIENWPPAPGRSAVEQFQAVLDGQLSVLVLGGLELADLPDPALARRAIEKADFVLSLEQRRSEIAQLADVVLPVGLLEETSGTFIDWQRRFRPVAQVVDRPRSGLTEIRLLSVLAQALGSDLGWRDAAGAAAAWDGLPAWTGPSPAPPAVPVPAADRSAAAGAGLRLASWRELIDDSRRLDRADELAASARPVAVRLSPATAARLGLDRPGAGPVELVGPAGSARFDLVLDSSLVDDVVWAPARAPGDRSLAGLGLAPGDPVRLSSGGDQ
ncbi:MAG: NADH-quinone oxidoreductase subunit G [Propionibacteriaceae bacterium]|jgi:NADH-quinone oxidoreductase subunit G|nr:NADH-quinone oxidoreductase subunit G [Propionibacteriaceae bacterium]